MRIKRTTKKNPQKMLTWARDWKLSLEEKRGNLKLQIIFLIALPISKKKLLSKLQEYLFIIYICYNNNNNNIVKCRL